MQEPAQSPPPAGAARGRVPIEELVDLGALAAGGRQPSQRRIREALPPGWILEPDGRHARRDLRVLARDGWVLLFGLISFGAVAVGLFRYSLPRGARGLGTLALLVAGLLLSGGLVGPLITKALHRR